MRLAGVHHGRDIEIVDICFVHTKITGLSDLVENTTRMTDLTINKTERKPKKPFDLVASLGRHWLKIAVFGSLLFILSSPIALLKKKEFYRAEGKLMIVPNIQTLIARTEDKPITGYYSDYVRTQCERIKAPELLEIVLDRLEPKFKTDFAPADRPIALSALALARRLRVEPDHGTHFVKIILEGEQAHGLAEVVNTTMTVFIEQTMTEAEGQESRRLSYLQAEKTALEEQILHLTDQYKEISGAIGTIDFREAGNIHNKTIESLQQAYINAYTYRINKENNLKAVIAEADAIKALPMDADVEDAILNSSVASRMDAETYQQIQALKESLQGLTENHPDKKIIQAKIKNLSESLNSSKGMLKSEIREILRTKRDARLQEKIAIAQSEFEAAKSAEMQLKARLDEAISNKAAVSDKILDGQQLENNLNNLQTQLTRIEDRINVLRVEARAPGRISLESLAVQPRGPAGSNLKKLLFVSFVLAFGSIAFVCILFDLTDKRVRSRKDILNAIGASVTWPISDYLLTQAEKIPFFRAARDDSSNVVSKAIHSLAVRLDRERREHNAKLAVFTGVDDRSGVSEILVNVAYAMTRFCKKVLVIDANLINPSVDKLLIQKSGARGLVEFMREDVDYSENIIYNEYLQFDILPAGRLLMMSEINLVDRSKLPPMLEALKEVYDFIIVDTPPVIVSDFTEFLLLHADMASLVIQGDRSQYDSLFIVGEILNRLQIPCIAVVLNWGAPRYQSAAQIIVDKILKPIKKKLNPSPMWSVRHTDNSQTGLVVRESAGPMRNTKKIMTFSKAWIFLLGVILFVCGVAGYFWATQSKGPASEPMQTNSNQAIAAEFHQGAPAEDFEKTPLLPPKAIETEAPAIPVTSEIPKAAPGIPEKALTVPITAVETEATAMAVADHAPKGAPEIPETTPPLPEETNGIKAPAIHVPDAPPSKPAMPMNHALHAEPWIIQQSPDAYTIQVASVKHKEYLFDFLKRHPLPGVNACYQKRHLDETLYVVIHGVFSDINQATQALKKLPEDLQASSPWIRRLGNIQKEIF